jgi:hypothetical protein
MSSLRIWFIPWHGPDMNAATIAGCRARVDRAEATIEQMETEWRTWVGSEPYPSRIEEDRQAGRYCLYIDFGATATPLKFPVMLGEIAHNLRFPAGVLTAEEFAAKKLEILARASSPCSVRDSCRGGGGDPFPWLGVVPWGELDGVPVVALE